MVDVIAVTDDGLEVLEDGKRTPIDELGQRQRRSGAVVVPVTRSVRISPQTSTILIHETINKRISKHSTMKEPDEEAIEEPTTSEDQAEQEATWMVKE